MNTSKALVLLNALKSAVENGWTDMYQPLMHLLNSAFDHHAFTNEVVVSFNGNEYRGRLSREEVTTAATNGKLDAIKAYKQRTGHSLVHSKLVVEKTVETLGIQFKK